MSASGPADDLAGDERLLARLRQLGLVELDALLFGAAGPERARLLAAHADDLADALGRARERMAALVQAIAAGPDPLALVSAPREVRARDGATRAAGGLAARLFDRAEAARTLARLDQACAALLPRLFELERRR
ncbi:MAG TPA: hypothetical protein VKZ63_09930 [Kofleriaceae bacterium]|nr:hypothetical protein [Kofleriaceae bacterium]